MRLLATAVVLSSILAFSSSVSLQTVTGSLSGTVLDGAGAPIAGASVTATGSGISRSTATGWRGDFTMSGLPVGSYELEVTAGGFRTLKRAVSVTEHPASALSLILAALPMDAPEQDIDARERNDKAGRDAREEHLQRNAATPRSSRAPAAKPGVAGGVISGPPHHFPVSPPFNTETYDRIHENGFRRVADHSLSTFSVDVDTASYSNVRRFLMGGALPPPDAVRTEELINYFSFAYDGPRGKRPFTITTEVARCPWQPAHRLALVGLQARRLDTADTPPRNLVFLLDVSGSMAPSNKLPLVKASMRMLADSLTGRDRIAIVVYAGSSGIVLPSTRGSNKEAIRHALASLEAGGSTNGAEGIHAAYQLAEASFDRSGVNRVILATDGDFNIGVTNQGELLRLIEKKRETDIFLSVLGVGEGNLKDSTMEKLADAGNGNYAYLDSLAEARRVLIEQAGGTLVTIAKDVKLQVEFNPATVSAYRLVGYENRVLQHEDFNDDRKDAGDMGAGHSVTALYEIVPAGTTLDDRATIDPLKYQQDRGTTPAARSSELMTVKARYKDPDGETSRLVSTTVADRETDHARHLTFAAAVAEFGMLLRRSEHRGQASYRQAIELARRSAQEDPGGYRAELIRLMELASALDTPERPECQDDDRRCERDTGDQ